MQQGEAATISIEPIQPLLVNARECARLLGISPRHLAGLHSSGRLPMPLHLGRRVLWRSAELAAWVEAGCPVRDKWISQNGQGRN